MEDSDVSGLQRIHSIYSLLPRPGLKVYDGEQREYYFTFETFSSVDFLNVGETSLFGGRVDRATFTVICLEFQ